MPHSVTGSCFYRDENGSLFEAVSYQDGAGKVWTENFFREDAPADIIPAKRKMFRAYRCASWDLSGEQTLVGESATLEEAESACLEDQKNNAFCGFRVEYQDGFDATLVASIIGTNGAE